MAQVNAAGLAERYPAERISGAIAYFDDLTDGSGPGVLVLAIREGRKPRRTPAKLAAEQVAYLDGIVAWLREHFPDLTDGGYPHHKAIIEVIHLHHRYGKGTLSASEHGPAIRAAVERYDAEHAAEVSA